MMNKKLTIFFVLTLSLLMLCSCASSPQMYFVRDTTILSRHPGKEIWGVSFKDYSGAWYLKSRCDLGLREDPEVCVVPVIDVPEEQRDYVIKMPQDYTQTVKELKFTVDFFQPYYEYNELIQISILVENVSDRNMSAATYITNNHYTSSFEGYHNSDKRMIKTDGRFQFRKYDYHGYEVNDRLFPKEKSTRLEYAHYADPGFFLPGEELYYDFSLMVRVNDSSQELSRIERYDFSIPVEVVLREE